MRRFWVGVMIFFAVVLMVLSTLARWVHDQVIDTDNFVAMADEILAEPAVQNAIANEIVTVVFEQPGVEDAIVEVIPEPLQPFQGPIVTGAQEGLKQGVIFVQNNQFLGDILDAQLRKVQTDLVEGKDVTFGLSDAADALGLSDQEGVVGQATDLIPEDFGTITVLSKQDVPWLYQIIDLLENLWVWLFLGSLALFAGAIAASQQRRKTIYTAALGLGITCVVLVILIQIGRSIALGSLPSDVDQSAAEAIVDIVLRGVRSRFIWLAVFSFIGFAIAIAWGRFGLTSAVRDFGSNTWATVRKKRAELATTGAGEVEGAVALEPGAATAEEISRWRQLRTDFGEFTEALELGDRIQTVAAYVDARIRMLRGLGVIAGALVLLLWPGPTTTVVIWVGALVVLYLGLLELLAGRVQEEAAEAEAEAEEVVAEAGTDAEKAAVGVIAGSEEKTARARVETEQPAARSRREAEAAAAEARAGAGADTGGPETETEAAEARPEVAPEPEPVEPTPASYEERLRLLRELGELKTLGILDEGEIREEKKKILGT